jgi:CRISPR-associated protein Csx3
MKIVIAGPPHSGKSVFLSGLTGNLPRSSYYLFRACPDGEGTWTWRSEEAARYRRKGQFTTTLVDWYCDRLADVNLAPLTLVDIGGIPSEENRRILTEGEINYGIILAGDPAAIPEWKQFLQGCGVEVIATIHSDYNGDRDQTDGPIMSVHYLERGEDVSSRPVIQKIAAMLLDMVAEYNKEKEMEKMINVMDLAEKLGKTLVKKTLPNGREIETIIWEGSDLPKIDQLLHNAGYGADDHVKVNGAAPAWLVASITHMVHPAAVSINSPDGYIPVGASVGENNNIEIKWDPESHILTVQAVDPSVPFTVEDLNNLPLPELFGEDLVVISGRIPNWMVASIADHYSHKVGAVACFQPGVGATVSVTHTQAYRLGHVV